MEKLKYSIWKFPLFALVLVSFLGCKKDIDVSESSSSLTYFQAGNQLKVQSVEKTKDGGFIYTGTQDEDAFLMKVDSKGEMQWYRTYGGSLVDVFYHGIQTNDGGFIAVGQSNSFGTDSSTGKVSGYAVKTDAMGNVIWESPFKHSTTELSFRSVAESLTGGFLMTGIAFFNTLKLNLVSINASGKMIFSRFYNDYSAIPPFNIQRNYHAIGLSVLQPNNSKIIVGLIMSKSNYVDEVGTMMPTLMETTTNGNPINLYRNDNQSPGNWYYINSMAEKKRNIILKILPLSDGYLFATSFEYPGNMDPILIQLIRTDASGNLANPIWKKEFKGLGNSLFFNINDNGDGTFLVSGATSPKAMNFSYPELFDNLQSMLIKINGNGDEIWTKYYGSEKNVNMAMCAQPNEEGGITMAGFTSINTNIYNKPFWMKLNSNGEIVSNRAN